VIQTPAFRLLATALLVLGASAPASSAASYRAPDAWTQFRLRDTNNAVVEGSLEATWQLRTGNPFSSSPTVADGALYAGDNGGGLYAIGPANGKILWQQHVRNPLMSAPIVYGDLVIVGEGNENSPEQSSPSHPILVGSPPNALLAFNRHTGKPQWQLTLPGSGMPTPAIVDGILVHHNGAGYVYGIDPLTGKVLYKRNLRSIASMSAILPMGKGSFATAGIDANAVWLLSAKDGSPVWRSDLSPVASGIGDCPAATDGSRIYCNYVMPPSSATPVQTERAANVRAYAVDARTARRVWDVVLAYGPLPIRNEASVPLLANGTLYCGAAVASFIYALDPRSGSVKWKTPTRGPVKGGIVEVGGRLYFGDFAGYLWAVDARTGRTIGQKNMRSSFNVGSPVAVGQTLVIGSRGGTLIALPLRAIRNSHDP